MNLNTLSLLTQARPTNVEMRNSNSNNNSNARAAAATKRDQVGSIDLPATAFFQRPKHLRACSVEGWAT